MSEEKQAAAGAPFPLPSLRAVNRAAERVEGVLLVLVLLTMVALAFAQVLLRQVRDAWPALQPVLWFGPLTQHLVVWVGLIGASIATREGRHFGVEALTKSLGPRGRRRLDLVLSSVGACFALALTVLAWNHLALREWRAVSPVFLIEGVGEHGLRVMRWQLLAIVPAELGLATFRFGLRALEALLLDDETWHAHDRSLRPDLEGQQVPVVEAAAVPAPVVAPEPAPPPPAPPLPEPPPPPAEPSPAPRLTASGRVRTPTEEVRTYRVVADTGDVIEPEPEPGVTLPPDEEAALVESDSSLDVEDASPEEAKAATERMPPAPPPAEPAPPEATEERAP